MVAAVGASARWPNWVWGLLAVLPVLAAALGAWQAASVLAALVLGCAAGQRVGRPAEVAAPVAEVAMPAPAVAPPVGQEALSSLRHDLNGILSPALLIADRLAVHADPAVQRAAAVVANTVERAAARVAKARG